MKKKNKKKKTAKLMGYSWTDEQLKFIVEARDSGESFVDIAEEFNEIFDGQINREKSPENIRQQYLKYQDFDFSNDELLKNIRSTHNARKSRSKVAKENKALLDYLEEQKTFEESFQEILKINKPVYHKPVKVKRTKSTERVLFAHLSDTHFQTLIDGETLGGVNQYGNKEEARRLAYFFDEVANYKLDKRKSTDLVLALNGDLGAGIIHDQESLPPMTTQFSAILHLLTQGISYLAGKFKSVRVVCTGGNHMRYMHKSNKGRQTKDKWDSFSTNAYVALKYALAQYKNVEFEIPTTPYALIDILGHKFFITHGDTVISPGNVGKNVSTEKIKNNVNDLISGLGDIDAVVMGHVHVPVMTTLNNGTELIINGTMSGIDEFAQSIGLVNNIPTQQMFEITKDYAVGDMRFVRLKNADKMKELEQIIKPFKGKF